MSSLSKRPVLGWFRAIHSVRGKIVRELASQTLILGMVSFGKEESEMAKRKEPEAPAGLVQGQLLTPAPASAPAPAQPPVQPIDITKAGTVDFAIGEKLPGVFGEYSSLDVQIGLSIPCDPNNFEKMIDKFLPRIVLKVQTTMNAIAQGSGYKAVWDQSQTPPSAIPTTPK